MSKLIPSYFSGAILGIIGLLAGIFFVYHFIGSDNLPGGPDFTEQGLVVGFGLAFIGWLIGIGALKYPINWLLALKDPDHEEELRLAGKDGGTLRYFKFTTDHKVVGIQYLVLVLFMLGFGGLGALLIRAELIATRRPALWDRNLQYHRHHAWHADDPGGDHLLHRPVW